MLRNLAKKIDSEKKKLEEERVKMNGDLKHVQDEMGKEIKRLEERRVMESERIQIEQEKLKVKHERDRLDIEEEWKRIQMAKRKLEQMSLQMQQVPQNLPVVEEPKIQTRLPQQSRSGKKRPLSAMYILNRTHLSYICNVINNAIITGRKSDEVADWLREKGFEAYIDRFLSNGYDNLHVSITDIVISPY